MIIKSLELYRIAVELKEPFTTSFGTIWRRETVVVKVVDENGNTGWGEIVSGSGPWYTYETIDTAIHIVKDYIVPMIRGREIDHPKTFCDIVKPIRGHNMAKAGIEMALWDLYAKELNMPLYSVLGGVRSRVECGVSIGIKSSIDELLKAIEYYLDQGYRRVKIKIKPGWDVNVVCRVRREYPNTPLQVDANAAYTLSDYRVFKSLDEYNLEMIEQPLHYDDLVDHAVLQRLIKTPICLDESIKSINDAKSAYKLGSCTIINIKPGRVGGIMESLRIHDFCMTVGIPVWIGGMLETGIGRAFLVALATLPNVKYPNDISASNRYYVEDIVEPPWTLNSDGTITVPTKPGIGVEVLEDRLRKYTVKTIKLIP
ncbi:MAG TPA: o-succinylbenzoate synthase [Desulfurococcales archaeon]|nr:o-succinylbenzoate synthase [Desulfurococcales archaeon]